MRTSQTHPLHIAELQYGDAKLGITFCPGKKQETGMTGAWDRDLYADLQVIKQWNPSKVIACCEPHEYVSLGVPDIFSIAIQHDLDFLPLAFPDDTVPGKSLNKALSYYIPVLASFIVNQKNVLFFCKGGLGRSGFLFARTLIELGEAPDDALKLLRGIRPGAVYTSEQEEFILKRKW